MQNVHLLLMWQPSEVLQQKTTRRWQKFTSSSRSMASRFWLSHATNLVDKSLALKLVSRLLLLKNSAQSGGCFQRSMWMVQQHIKFTSFLGTIVLSSMLKIELLMKSPGILQNSLLMLRARLLATGVLKQILKHLFQKYKSTCSYESYE